MKKNVIKVVIALIFLAVFNLLYFVAGGEHTTADWISYAFVHAAFLCLALTPLFGAGIGKGLTILIGSLWLRALGYFFIELVVGVAFLLASPEGYVWPLVVQAILLAAFLIMQLMSVLANDSTTASIRRQRDESACLQDLKDRLGSLMNAIDDKALRQLVRECHEALSACPIQSYPEAGEKEQALRSAVDGLCSAITDGATAELAGQKAKSVLIAVQERNAAIRKCRKSNT